MMTTHAETTHDEGIRARQIESTIRRWNINPPICDLIDVALRQHYESPRATRVADHGFTRSCARSPSASGVATFTWRRRSCHFR